MITTFSLKEGETRINSVPIPHPLKEIVQGTQSGIEILVGEAFLSCGSKQSKHYFFFQIGVCSMLIKNTVVRQKQQQRKRNQNKTSKQTNKTKQKQKQKTAQFWFGVQFLL